MTSGPSSQWTAEVEVTPVTAAELIGEQFPELRGQEVTLLATGWDNNAFSVGSRWLFRFPRREIALPGIRREIELLPRLAARLPLPVPDPCFVGRPSARFPWPFFGANFLAGAELADSGLDREERVRAAASLGGFLGAGRARAALLSAYGRPAGAHRELAARTLAISLAAALAEYAADDGRDVLLAECLAGLRNATS